MNAQEARRLSDKNKLKNSRVPQLQEKISESASKGLYSYTLLGSLSEDDAFLLRSMGYKVTHHPNPDPGHPCSSDYITITW